MESAQELFLERNELVARLERAIFIATQAYEEPSATNRDWIIDQMVRSLTGCPVDDDGVQGESEEYKETIAAVETDDLYWETGMEPTLRGAVTEITSERLEEIRTKMIEMSDQPCGRGRWFRNLPRVERDAYLRMTSEELAIYYKENPDALSQL